MSVPFLGVPGGVKTGVYLNHSAADRSGRRVRLGLTAQMASPMASMVTGPPGRRAAAKRTARDEASKAGCHAADARRPIGIVLPDRIVLDRDAAKERVLTPMTAPLRAAYECKPDRRGAHSRRNFAKCQEQLNSWIRVDFPSIAV